MFGRNVGSCRLIVLMAISCISCASLADPRDLGDHNELMISGVIGPGTYQHFISAVQREQPETVVLEGPGGLVFEAILIGTEIHRRGIATHIPGHRSCASACAIIFLSGQSKSLGPGSSIGLHAAANNGSADVSGTRLMTEYLRRVGVPSSLLRRVATVPPDDIYWLSRSEQQAMRIRAAD
jgi:hypothetical protein